MVRARLLSTGRSASKLPKADLVVHAMLHEQWVLSLPAAP